MRSLAACLVTLLLLPACGDEPVATFETEVLVTFDADSELTARWSTLSIAIANDAPVETITATRDDDGPLPHVVRLVPEGGDASRRFNLVATLRGRCDTGEDCELGVLDVFDAGFTEGESRTLRLRFDAACEGMTCARGESCVAGMCEGACFEPAPAGTETLTAGMLCPVYVDARGIDDPEACIDPTTPCQNIDSTVRTYFPTGSGRTLYIRGETESGERLTYAPFDIREGGGNPDRPSQMLPWPGTGRPIIAGGDHPVSFNTGSVRPEYWIVEGLEITGGAGNGVLVQRNVTHLTIRDCFIHGNPDGGIEILGANHITIEDNLIVDSGFPTVSGTFDRVGILIRAGSEDVLVQRNSICRSEDRAIAVTQGGYQRITIAHNSVVDSGRHAVAITDIGGPVTVVDNILTHNGGAGVFVGADAIVDSVDFNLFFDNDDGAFDGVGIPSALRGENNLIDVDPRFIDRMSCDLALAEGSPATAAASDGTNIGAL